MCCGAGISVDARLLRDVPGYDLYQASALPFGPLSEDFACPGSATSKNVCELAGNLTVHCWPLPSTSTSHIHQKPWCCPVALPTVAAALMRSGQRPACGVTSA